ncbi:MAG: BamA/TamA family outer membrane protein [Saprospiraceae bacterium]|nr:BamA/TamA family outer membrane protein [Saprospiraceae bacterium]
MSKVFPLFGLLFLFFDHGCIWGQNRFSTKDSLTIRKLYKSQMLESVDSISLDTLLLWANQNGYLDAGWVRDFQKVNHVDLGLQYKFFDGKDTLSYAELTDGWKDLLRNASNMGYPFTKLVVHTDSLVRDSILVINIKSFQMDRMTFAKPKIEGNLRISNYFIQRITNINQGSLFSLKKLEQADEKLRKVAFISMAKPFQWSVYNRKCTPIWYLNKKSTSKGEFILGLIPKNEGVSNKLTLTGLASLELQNALAQGEKIQMFYRQLPSGTRELKLDLDWPYIGFTSMGAVGSLYLFKRDTSFSELGTSVGLTFDLSETLKLKGTYQYKTSAILTINKVQILNTLRLPSYTDFKLNGLGLELDLNRLDYIFNPKKGIAASLKLSGGIKIIEKNQSVSSLIDPEGRPMEYLYDSILLNAQQYQAQLVLKYFVPISKNYILHVLSHSGYIYSNAPIFDNEKFRLGGNLSIRGFEEQRFLTNSFSYLTMENRWITGQNSHFFAGVDYGWLDLDGPNKKWTLGLSLGTRFDTKAGIFTLSYAMGRVKEERWSLKNGKVHIGYAAIF